MLRDFLLKLNVFSYKMGNHIVFGGCMECKKDINLERCNCTYEPCSRKGLCCECIVYHKSLNQLPACFFSSEAEMTYDRSINKFIEDNQ